MIKIENVILPTPEQWKAVVMATRNPLNSWDRYDSHEENGEFIIGPNDYSLMKRLVKAGTDHRKFMRMITVMLTITAPRYWWEEMATYKVGSVFNSCSTMHKIAAKEFTLDDFSTEHLLDFGGPEYEHSPELITPMSLMKLTIDSLNYWREAYLSMASQNVSGAAEKAKEFWWQLIQLLPQSYNQKRTAMLNYEVLANIYKSRKNHKLDEWKEHANVDWTQPIKYGEAGFCDWIKTLPYSELITGDKQEG